jgi:hypothetical protein
MNYFFLCIALLSIASAALASNGDNQEANGRLPFNIDLALQPTEVGWLDKRQHQVNLRAWTVFSSLMGYEPKQAESSQKKVTYTEMRRLTINSMQPIKQSKLTALCRVR